MQSAAQHLNPDESILKALAEKIDVSSIAFEARQSCTTRNLAIDEQFPEVVTELIARNVKEIQATLSESGGGGRLPPNVLHDLALQIFTTTPGRYEDYSNFVTTKLLLASAIQQLACNTSGSSPALQPPAEEEFKKIVASGDVGLLPYLEPFFKKDYFFTPQGTDLLLTAFQTLAERKPEDCSLDSFPFKFIISPQHMNDPRFVSIRAGLFKEACEAGNIPPLLWSVHAPSLDPTLFGEITRPDSSRSIIQGIDSAFERDDPAAVVGLLPLIAVHAEAALLKSALSERASKWVLETAREGGIRDHKPVFQGMFFAGTKLSSPAVVCSERFVGAVKEGIARLIQEDVGLPPLYVLANLVPGSYAAALSKDRELSAAVGAYLQRVVNRTTAECANRGSPHRIPIRAVADIQQTTALVENIFGLDSTSSQALDALLPKPGLFVRLCGLADRLSIRAMAKATCPVRAAEHAIQRLLHASDRLETLTPQAINSAMQAVALVSISPHLPSLYRLQTRAELASLKAHGFAAPDVLREHVLAEAMRFLHPTDPLLEGALAASLKVSDCRGEVVQGRKNVLSHLQALKGDNSPSRFRDLAAAYRGSLFPNEEMRDVQERSATTVEQLSRSR